MDSRDEGTSRRAIHAKVRDCSSENELGDYAPAAGALRRGGGRRLMQWRPRSMRARRAHGSYTGASRVGHGQTCDGTRRARASAPRAGGAATDEGASPSHIRRDERSKPHRFMAPDVPTRPRAKLRSRDIRHRHHRWTTGARLAHDGSTRLQAPYRAGHASDTRAEGGRRMDTR